jgi:hypothetical protein
MKTGFGVQAIALLLFFVVTLCNFLSALQSRNIVLFGKGILQMPFIIAYSPPMKLLLFNLLQAILRPTLRNIGLCSKLSMVFCAVHNIGTTKSMLFLF